MKKNVIVKSNREYDYFGNVLEYEYEYDYFPSYSSTSTRTQKVLVLEYEYTSTITPSLDWSEMFVRRSIILPIMYSIPHLPTLGNCMTEHCQL